MSAPCCIMSNRKNLRDAPTVRDKEKDRQTVTEGERYTKRGLFESVYTFGLTVNYHNNITQLWVFFHKEQVFIFESKYGVY